MEPKVSYLQAPKVRIGSVTLGSMEEQQIRAAFAERMHELCDALEIPRGHGRNTALGQRFKVTPNAARKWLLGLSYPEMAKAVEMCEAAHLNVLWLLQGSPPKRGEHVDANLLGLAEAVAGLPQAEREAVLQFARFKVQETAGWYRPDTLRGYLRAIDSLRSTTESPTPMPVADKQTGTAH